MEKVSDVLDFLPYILKKLRNEWGQFFIIDKQIYGTASGFPEIVVLSPNFSNACLTGLSPGNRSEGIYYNPEMLYREKKFRRFRT